MVILQDPEGLVFWPEWEIASWTPEYKNRWQAVHCSGAVAHRPTPPPPGPWVPLGRHLVLPELLRVSGEEWVDAGGYTYPWQPLPQVAGPPPSPVLSNLPCTQDEVFQVTRYSDRDCHWVTDLGEFRTPGLSEKALTRLHPGLFQVSFHRYLNKRRLRRISWEGQQVTYHFHDGRTLSEHFIPARAAEFGLSNFRHLEPRCPGLYYSAGLRDWPVELASAKKPFLSKHFSSPRRLISNVVWQAWRYRMQGVPTSYGRSHRDFWYEPLVHILGRAGMLEPRDKRHPRDDDGVWGNRTKLYKLYQIVLGEFVTEHQFFTLKQFGFEDPQPERRWLGQRRPQILLVAEKTGSQRMVEKLQQEFGISAILLSGQPSILATEYLAEILRPYGPIFILALVDYDPHGWIIAQAVATHLEFFGLEVAGPPRPIVLPEVFSAEEREILAIPCLSKTARQRTLNADWVAKGGGIEGLALGIHVGHLKPYARLRMRVAEMLG